MYFGLNNVSLLLQEDLPLSSLSSASSASIMSQLVPNQELLPDQESANKAGSALSTPRSLRPGTVPKLDLSPAIALHMAELVGEEEEEQNAGLQEEKGTATERQAVAMASFDDLSGPDSPDTDREEEEGAATQRQAPVMASLDDFSGRKSPDTDGQEEDGMATQQQAAAMPSFDDLSGPESPPAASLAPSTTASQASDHSMHDMADRFEDAQVADHALMTSSASSSAMLAAQALSGPSASTAQLHLSVPSASEALTSVISEGTQASSGEASHSSHTHNGGTTSPHQPDVAVSNSTLESIIATAHAQATVVDAGSTAPFEHSPAPADSAAHAAPPAQLSHPLPAVRSEESSPAASSVSEELEFESAYLTQESSPESDHLLLSQAASQAVVSRLKQTEATTESAVEADDVQLSFGSPEADPLKADTPLLQPESIGVSSLPLLAGNIGKKRSEDKEQWHLAPDLLAYAEAAMTEGGAEADPYPLVSQKAAGEAEAASAALLSSTFPVPEAVRHGQQADSIAAELFDELLTDAVQSMTNPGESPLYMLYLPRRLETC